MSSSSQSPFHLPIDLSHTALLLADVQSEVLARFPPEKQAPYLSHVLSLVKLFRDEIERRRSTPNPEKGPYEEVPLIIHHVLPFGYNGNAFISPYNKLSSWVKSLETKGFFTIPDEAKDPRTPRYAVPDALLPPPPTQSLSTKGGARFSGPDEILLPKFQTSSFGSSDLLGYLRARGIRHLILCGLTTMGAILGTARQGADLDYHIVIPRQGVMDDEEDVNEFLLERVLGKFVDVVDMNDVKGLF
jgi:nicotinamidase-related amidase